LSAPAYAADVTTRSNGVLNDRYGQPVQERYSDPAPAATPAAESSTPTSSGGR